MKKYILTTLVLLTTLMAQAQTKSAFIHMKTGEIKEILCSEIDSITFAEHINFDYNVEANQSIGIYYGAYNEAGQFIVAVSDAEMTSDGLPTKAGQSVLLFYAMSEPTTDYDNIQLASGQYTASDDFSKMTLYNGQSGYLYFMYCNGINSEGEPEGWGIDMEYATMNVVNNNGQYYIDFKGGNSERESSINFKDVHVTFQGTIDFANQDPAYYTYLTKDYDITPTAMSARYTCTPSYGYGNYSFAFYNTPTDSEGFITGAGDVISLELLTQPAVPMDLSLLTGDYTVANVLEGPYEPGHFLSGVNYYYYGMYLPMGTYLAFYDESGSMKKEIGFVTGGTAHISVDGTNITYNFDFIAEGGHHFTVNYTASSATIYDYTSNSAKSNMPGLSPNGAFNAFKAITRHNVLQPSNTLKLIKK